MTINKYKNIVLLICVLFFISCKTNHLIMIERDLNQAFPPANLFNGAALERGRELMLAKLSADIMKNDTIIIMERFTATRLSYAVTIYESNKRRISGYRLQRRIQGGQVLADSLVSIDNFHDRILPLVIEGRLDEIKQRASEQIFTPHTDLIISIGIRDKRRNRFNFKVFRTSAFNPAPCSPVLPNL